MHRLVIALIAASLFSASVLAQQPGREGDREWRRHRHAAQSVLPVEPISAPRAGDSNPYTPRVGDANPYAPRAGDANPYATRGGDPNPYATRGGDPVKPLEQPSQGSGRRTLTR